ncbi:MAG: hypothetical protein ACH346_04770 [Chthoniobacterales bacterium]
MKLLLLSFASLFLPVTSNFLLHADANISRSFSPTTVTSLVTASDYCAFLNVAASSHAEHLYDERMVSDPTTASILRLGRPGEWHYEVLAGKENVPVEYVNKQVQARYGHELQAADKSLEEKVKEPKESDDGCSLSWNKNLFEIEIPSTTLALLRTPSLTLDSDIAGISSAAALLGLLAAPELMMRFGDFSVRGVTRGAQEGTQQERTAQNLNTPNSLVDSEEARKSLTFSHLIERPLIDKDPIYDEANRSWAQNEQAWEERTSAAKNLEMGRLLTANVKELLQAEEEKLAGEHPNEERLKKLRSTLTMASEALALLDITPLPIGSSIEKISAFAQWYSKKFSEIARDATAEELMEVEAKLEEMEKKYAETQEAAPQLMLAAQEIEESVTRQDIQKTHDLISVVNPPREDNSEAWNHWAAALTAHLQSNQSRFALVSLNSSIQEVVKLAETNPIQARQIISNAWNQRIQASQATIRNVARNQQNELTSFEKALRQTNERALAVKKVIKTKEKTLEKASEKERLSLQKLQQANETLTSQISPTTSSLQANLIQQREAAEKQKRNIAELTTLSEKATENRVAANEMLERAKQLLSDVKQEALPVLDHYWKTKKTFERHLVRATARAQADRQAFIDTWPELPTPETASDIHQMLLTPLDHFLQRVRSGDLPILPWNRIAPDLLSDQYSEQNSPNRAITPPSILKEEAERRGREALGMLNPSQGGPKILEQLIPMMLNEELLSNGIDIRHPQPEETERWNTYETILKLQEEIGQITKKIASKAKSSQSSKSGMIGQSSPSASTASELDMSETQSVMSRVSRKTTMTTKTTTSLAAAAKKKSSTDQLTSDLLIKKEALQEAEENWSHYAQDSEKKRVILLGVPPRDWETESKLKWEKLDQQAIRTRKWTAEMTRWMARAEADQRRVTSDELHQSLLDTSAESTPEQIRKAQEAYDKAHHNYLAADQRWSQLAEEALSKVKEEDSARKDLKEADRAINRIIKSFVPALKQVKERAEEKFFLNADKMQQEAIRAAENSRFTKDRIEQFKKEADQAEKEALACYAFYLQTIAIQEIRSQIPNALEKWHERAAGNKLDETSSSLNRSKNLKKSQEKNSRQKAIIEIEKKAYKAAEAEHARLQEVEAIWNQHAIDQATKLFIEEAAAEALQGDLQRWSLLTEEQRAAYNEIIKASNNLYEVQKEKVINDAKIRVTAAKQELEKKQEILHSLTSLIGTGTAGTQNRPSISSKQSTDSRNSDFSQVSQASYPSHHTYLDDDDASSATGSSHHSTVLTTSTEPEPLKSPEVKAAEKNLQSAEAELESQKAVNNARETLLNLGQEILRQPHLQGSNFSDFLHLPTRAIVEAWQKAADVAQMTSENFLKAAAAEENSHHFFAALWNQISEHSKRAINHYFEYATHLEEANHAEAHSSMTLAKESEQKANHSVSLTDKASRTIKTIAEEENSQIVDQIFSPANQQLETELARALQRAKSLSPKDPNFEPAWDEVIIKAEEEKAVGEKILHLYQDLQQEEEIDPWQEGLFMADYTDAFIRATDYTLRPLYLQAEKTEEELIFLLQQAEAGKQISPQDSFSTVAEKSWTEAISLASEAQRCWKGIAQKEESLLTLAISLPEEAYEVCQKNLEEDRYNVALYMLLSEFFQASQCQEKTPEEAKQAWEHFLQISQELEVTLSEHDQAIWKNDLALLEAYKTGPLISISDHQYDQLLEKSSPLLLRLLERGIDGASSFRMNSISLSQEEVLLQEVRKKISELAKAAVIKVFSPNIDPEVRKSKIEEALVETDHRRSQRDLRVKQEREEFDTTDATAKIIRAIEKATHEASLLALSKSEQAKRIARETDVLRDRLHKAAEQSYSFLENILKNRKLSLEKVAEIASDKPENSTRIERVMRETIACNEKRLQKERETLQEGTTFDSTIVGKRARFMKSVNQQALEVAAAKANAFREKVFERDAAIEKKYLSTRITDKIFEKFLNLYEASQDVEESLNHLKNLIVGATNWATDPLTVNHLTLLLSALEDKNALMGAPLEETFRMIRSLQRPIAEDILSLLHPINHRINSLQAEQKRVTDQAEKIAPFIKMASDLKNQEDSMKELESQYKASEEEAKAATNNLEMNKFKTAVRTIQEGLGNLNQASLLLSQRGIHEITTPQIPEKEIAATLALEAIKGHQKIANYRKLLAEEALTGRQEEVTRLQQTASWEGKRITLLSQAVTQLATAEKLITQAVAAQASSPPMREEEARLCLEAAKEFKRDASYYQIQADLAARNGNLNSDSSGMRNLAHIYLNSTATTLAKIATDQKITPQTSAKEEVRRLELEAARNFYQAAERVLIAAEVVNTSGVQDTKSKEEAMVFNQTASYLIKEAAEVASIEVAERATPLTSAREEEVRLRLKLKIQC